MAKVKLNSLLADLRGRLGSVVFSSNAAGYHCRVLKVPTRTPTAAQSAIRTRFSSLISAWNLLTPTERGLWTTYAAQVDNVRYDWFGDPYYPNARAQFLSINTARLQVGDSITATAPTGTLPAALPTMSAGIDPSGVAFTSYIDNDAAFDASIDMVHCAVSITNSPGRGTPILPYKYLATHETSDTWPFEIDDLLTALYGSLLVSGSWWLTLTPLSSEYRPGTATVLTAAIGEETP